MKSNRKVPGWMFDLTLSNPRMSTRTRNSGQMRNHTYSDWPQEHSNRHLRWFCCFQEEKTHPKRRSSRHLRTFCCVQMDITHPKKQSSCYLLRFPQNSPNQRTYRTTFAWAKKGVRWLFVRSLCRKRPPNERIEQSGEFKRVKDRDEVFVSRGGFWQDQRSKVTKLQLGAVW